MADCVVLVARSGQTGSQSLKRTVELLRRVNAKIAGVVVNDLAPKSLAYTEYYGHSSRQSVPLSPGGEMLRAQRLVTLAAWLAFFLLAIASCMNAADDGRSVLQVAGGDLLEINVFDIPELSGKFRVSNTGSISLPLIGELAVQDNRTDQVEHTIAQKLEDGGYVRNPQVSVFVAEFATQGVSVLGEVKKPGIYPSFGSHRLLDYLSMAEGTTPLAGSMVDITRRGAAETKESH